MIFLKNALSKLSTSKKDLGVYSFGALGLTSQGLFFNFLIVTVFHCPFQFIFLPKLDKSSEIILLNKPTVYF